MKFIYFYYILVLNNNNNKNKNIFIIIMDEYNINNIQKINSINFININNDNLSSNTYKPINDKIKYLKSLNKLNSHSIKKLKDNYSKKNPQINDNILKDQYKESSLTSNKLYSKYNIGMNSDFDMNKADISDLKIKSKQYKGILQNNNYQKNLNTYNKINNLRYNDKNSSKNFKSMNSFKSQKNNNNNNYVSMNFNNNNLNYFTDFSLEDNSNTTNDVDNNNYMKINIYINKINEYKKNNEMLKNKIIIYNNNLQNKLIEIQKLQQINKTLQNELNIAKSNNNANNNNYLQNEEIKKMLMQKNKIIKDVYQKMQTMKKNLDDKMIQNSKLCKILTKKNSDLMNYQNEIIEKDKKIDELNSILNQIKSDKDKNYNNLNSEINIKNELNEELKKENIEKEKQIEVLSKKINDLEIDIKGVKSDEKEYFFQNKKNKEIIEQKNKEIKELKEQISSTNNNNSDINKNFKKESDILIKRIEDLTNENNKLNKHINFLNSKNSQKLTITPDNYQIISNKNYKNLIWYLLFKKSISNESNDINNYNNYVWVKESEINKNDINKFNISDKVDDEKKIKELNDYIIELHEKLEMKEEKINTLDYKNQKLADQLHNKTANIKGNILLAKQSKDNSNLANSFNTEAVENEKKYKNILEKLHDSNKRNMHLHNQVIILKEQLNEKSNLEKNFPHDMKDIDPQLHDSGFLDDDSVENKDKEIDDLFNNENDIININNINNNEQDKDKINNKIDLNENISNNEELNKAMNQNSLDDPFKESEKKVDEFLANGAGEEDDFDELKMINKQMNFLKEEIKDNRDKNKKLEIEIKELFNKIKCNDKNRKNIVQICQILNFQPALIDQIISNKKPKTK